MSQEEQGKKTSHELPAGKDDKAPASAKPTELSDEDLDKVAGGLLIDVTGAGIKAGTPKRLGDTGTHE